MPEILEKRTRNSKTHSLGGRKFAWDGTIGSLHYKDNPDDPAELFKEIDNVFEPAVAPWDWQMLHAGYHIRVKEDFTAGQIIEFEVQGETVQFQPMALEWTNDLDQIQPIAMPHNVMPVITNPVVDLLPAVGVPSHQGTIRWNDAYGQGIDFQWKCSSTRLLKILEIENLNKLPTPQQYILDGGSPVLRLNLIFASSGADIYVDGGLWDKSTKKQTFSIIEFRKDGEELWGFLPLRYWGSNPESEDNDGQSIATLEKRGNKLYISIRVPYSWLQQAIYPIFIDVNVDEQVGASSDDGIQIESTGTMYLTFANDSHQSNSSAAARYWTLKRWTGVAIPQSSTIGVAYIKVYNDPAESDDMNGNFHFELGASPGTLTTTNFDITDRDRTTASASWIEDDIAAGGADWFNTPSLVTPLQELINAYTISTLVSIWRPNTDVNKLSNIRAWDNTSDPANTWGAQIHIEYTEAAPEGDIDTAAKRRMAAGIIPFHSVIIPDGIIGLKDRMQIACLYSENAVAAPEVGVPAHFMYYQRLRRN